MKGGIVADRGGEWLEQALGEHACARAKFNVAIEYKARITYHRDRPPC